MMLITPDYLHLQEKLHAERADYGTSSARHAEFVTHVAAQLGTRDILDYGCGKAGLQKSLPHPIANYDPAMAEYSRRPKPADIVVCTDVLEHIEPACLLAVLQDLSILTRRLLFLNVATRPAVKFLADGRNAHLIQESPSWWVAQLLHYFDMTSFQVGKGEFNALFVPPYRAALENAEGAA